MQGYKKFSSNLFPYSLSSCKDLDTNLYRQFSNTMLRSLQDDKYCEYFKCLN